MTATGRTAILEWLEDALREMQLIAPGATVDASTGLLGRGIGADSVEALQLVAAIETRYGLTLDDDELTPEHFRTLGSLAAFVESRLASHREEAP